MSTTKDYPYRHRDLNWLSFNERVLQEAEDSNNPLYERLKFLAIFSSNLDEFFQVRVSRLRQIKKIDKNLRKKLILKPNTIIKEILSTVSLQQERFGAIFYKQLIPELAKNSIHLISHENFNPKQQEFAAEFFISKIQPILDPLVIDLETANPTFLDNNKLYSAVTFENSRHIGFVNIPSDQLERFICFPDQEENFYVAFIDDIIKYNLDKIFDNELRILDCFSIKISRDAELYIDDEFEGVLAEKIKASLSQRNIGQATRLLYDSSMSKELRKKIRKHLNLGKVDMIPGGRYHNFSDFFKFPNPKTTNDLHYQKQIPIQHQNLDNSTDYFNTIFKKDQLVHFPYMSFDYVQNFIDQAAEDPKVSEIKISLYRVAKESKLTNALLKAIENGKKVTVFVEVKARFDEENNLKWGAIFEKKGANVHYSYPKIKVHSKILLIKRSESARSQLYVYIGTGNFNAKTSKIYCDHGLFTANTKVTNELAQVFEVLAGKLLFPKFNHLLVSPFTTRTAFEDLIENEISNAEQGKKSGINAKLNSLEDQGIINKLYKASCAGVEINLLVRGFTCLIPGIKGVSENIKVTSIVDRYLEHGRIYQFENNGHQKIFMGSADWMTRNLDKRIEVLTPILDIEIAKELKEILAIQLNDTLKARIQDENESNIYVENMSSDSPMRSQYEIRSYLKAKQESLIRS